MTIFSHSLYLSHCKLEMYMYFNIPANMYMYFNILANNVFYYFFIIFILIFYYFMGQNCHTVTFQAQIVSKYIDTGYLVCATPLIVLCRSF